MQQVDIIPRKFSFTGRRRKTGREGRWKMLSAAISIVVPGELEKQTVPEDNPRIILIDGSRRSRLPSLEYKSTFYLIYGLEKHTGILIR